MLFRIFLIIISASILAAPVPPQKNNLKNPVARCADAGVMNYRGKYYISGVGLPGKFLISDDLVHWHGPTNFFQTKAKWLKKNDEKEMHAPGIKYVNGKIHFYWNGIGYAYSTNPLGPYKENVNKRFDREIDPFLFADDDGKLYFYTVKYTDGNEIYGQKMSAPDKLISKPVPLITAIPNSWEWRDWKVNEGPEVFKHNDVYYLLYAANVTSVEMANYSVGCATAKNPLGFSNKTKYPWSVLEPSYERIFDDNKTIIPCGDFGAQVWLFTTNKPPRNWMQPYFKTDKNWKKAFGAFGSPIRKQSKIHNVQTVWNTDNIWLRSQFILPEKFSTNLQLKVRHLDSAKFYLNGFLAHKNPLWAGPRLVNLSPAAISKLHAGTNTIAVHCRSTRNEKYLDVGLIDPGEKKEDDIIWNIGQPNILRGPNGVEWFAVYFALWNEGPHNQGINRVHFFGNELYIDGPTGANPKQYQPPPYKPTFSTNNFYVFGKKLIPSSPAENYIFEVWLKPSDEIETYTWFADKSNFQKFIFDPNVNAIICQTMINKKRKIFSLPLNKSFNFSVFHKIRFEKNGNVFSLFIDDTKLARKKIPYNKKGIPGFLSKNKNALLDGIIYTVGWEENSENMTGWKPCANDILTKGDKLNYYEFSTQINLQNCTNGSIGILPVYIDKNNYLAVQLTNNKIKVIEKKNGKIVSSHSKKLARKERLYFRGKKPAPPKDLKITASHCWKHDTPNAAADGLISRYSRENIPKICFWDHCGTKEWIKYEFQSTKTVDCAEVIWYDDTKDGGDCETPQSWRILYKDESGKWLPCKGATCVSAHLSYGTEIDKLNYVKFSPVKTSALKLEIKSKPKRSSGLYEWTVFNSARSGRKVTGDLFLKRGGDVSKIDFIFDERPPYSKPASISYKKISDNHFEFTAFVPPGKLFRIIRAYATVKRQKSYNIRAVKLSDRVIIFLDGRQIFEIPGQWQKSQVVLTAKNCKAAFDSVTCFDIEK